MSFHKGVVCEGNGGRQVTDFKMEEDLSCRRWSPTAVVHADVQTAAPQVFQQDHIKLLMDDGTITD